MILSICIPTYNRVKQLDNCLNSILISKRNVENFNFEICVSDNNSAEDTESTIKKYSKELKIINFDIIFSGLQSNDHGHSQIGLLLSELLNTSHASLVMGTEILDNGSIKVKQELENGWFQWSELDLPASLTIQSGINTPRYASLRGIMMAKNKLYYN